MAALDEGGSAARAVANLEALMLTQMASLLPDYVRLVADGERGFRRALADFDWDFQPSVPRGKVEEPATLRFLEDAENVLLIGSSGVGKTHIAVALGIEAVRAGREVRFVDCARLIEDLRDAHKRGILKNRLKYYTHSKLLIIDELGYLDIEEGGADLLFQLVSARYERRSTIITTNAGISSWGEVLGDTVKAGAIADRACHHCTMMKITGRSYRLKDLPVERKEE